MTKEEQIQYDKLTLELRKQYNLEKKIDPELSHKEIMILIALGRNDPTIYFK